MCKRRVLKVASELWWPDTGGRARLQDSIMAPRCWTAGVAVVAVVPTTGIAVLPACTGLPVSRDRKTVCPLLGEKLDINETDARQRAQDPAYTLQNCLPSLTPKETHHGHEAVPQKGDGAGGVLAAGSVGQFRHNRQHSSDTPTARNIASGQRQQSPWACKHAHGLPD